MQLRIWNSLELMQYRLLELSEAYAINLFGIVWSLSGFWNCLELMQYHLLELSEAYAITLFGILWSLCNYAFTL